MVRRILKDENLGDECLKLFFKVLRRVKYFGQYECAFDRLLEITKLSAREATTLILRYKNYKEIDMTLQEIGEKFGCNKERIRQLICKCMRKLRQPSRHEDLILFLKEEDSND